MARRVQLIRYAGATMASTTGKNGEVMVNTTNNSLVVHDEATEGGHEQARADMSNVPNATASIVGRMTPALVADIVANIAAIAALDAAKADKLVPAAVSNVAVLDAAGNLADSGQTVAQILTAARIPAGSKMLFGQAAAPTGWTIDDTFSDRMIRVVDSTVTGAYGTDWVTDGNGGSWTISGVTVDGHAITISQMPSHTHGYSRSSFSGGVTIDAGAGLQHELIASATGAQGGSGTHNHGLTSDAVWRPQYLDMILCTKD